MNLRAVRGLRIFRMGNQIRRMSDREYMVRSQTECGEWYELIHTSRGYLCSCPDWMAGEPWCKHAWAVELYNGDRARAERGCMIFAAGDVERVSDGRYRVASQSSDGSYEVTRRDRRWECTCPDHTLDGSHCKHIFAVEIEAGVREPETGHAVVRGQRPSECKFCGSADITKKGVRTPRKGRVQQYLCKACGRRFVPNLGFERKRATPEQITTAVDLVFGGMSSRKAASAIRALGCRVTYKTVQRWAERYADLMTENMDLLVPLAGEAWRMDEIYMDISGRRRYLFAMIDSDKRYWLAKMVAENKGTDDVRPMFEEAAKIGGKIPATTLSDGASNFAEAHRDTYAPANALHKVSVHVGHVRASGDPNNNQMESFNGNTVRLRESAARGLKKDDSAIIKGLRVYHNFVRPHLGLPGNQTPGEAAGIIIEGDNKWRTMIEHATRQENAEIAKARRRQAGERPGKT